MASLRRAVVAAATEILIERPGRTRSWLAAGDDQMAAVRPDDLTAAGKDLLTRLNYP
jgi:hypothetical protein